MKTDESEDDKSIAHSLFEEFFIFGCSHEELMEFD